MKSDVKTLNICSGKNLQLQSIVPSDGKKLNRHSTNSLKYGVCALMDLVGALLNTI